MCRHKKVFISAGLLAIAALTFGGAAMGAYLFNHAQSATVRLAGEGVGVFSDAACTIPLEPTTALSFGTVFKTAPTAPTTIYLKNTGDYALKPEIEAASFQYGALTCTEATYGVLNGGWVAAWTAGNLLDPGEIMPLALSLSVTNPTNFDLHKGKAETFRINIKVTD